MIEFRKDIPRVGVLLFILIFSMLSQVIRWLPVYLSSVAITACEEACSSVPFTPLCSDCAIDDAFCTECHECRSDYDSEFYNFEDGICMTTKEYGVITGVGFSLTFSIFGILAGFFVDKISERDTSVLGLASFACGIVTLASAYSNNFMQVLGFRAILGAMQAFIAPATVTVLTKVFQRPSERPFANASYTIGLYFGAGLSSLSTVLSLYTGWSLIFSMVGWVTIVTFMVYEVFIDIDVFGHGKVSSVMISKEYDADRTLLADTFCSSMQDRCEKEHLVSTLPSADGGYLKSGKFQVSNVDAEKDSFMSSNSNDEEEEDDDIEDIINVIYNIMFNGNISGALSLLFGASCLRFMASIVVFVYAPILVSRKFPHMDKIFSICNALVILVFGSISSFVGGKLGQEAVKLYGLSGLTRLIIYTTSIALIPVLTALLSSNFWCSMAGLAVGYLIGEAWLGAAMALLQALSPKKQQGLSMSLFLFFNWNAAAFGTDFLGWLDPGTQHIATGLSVLVAATYIGSIALFILLHRLISPYNAL